MVSELLFLLSHIFYFCIVAFLDLKSKLVTAKWKWPQFQNINTHTNIHFISPNPKYGNKQNIFPSTLLVFEHHLENLKVGLPRQCDAIRTQGSGGRTVVREYCLLVTDCWSASSDLWWTGDSNSFFPPWLCNGSKPLRFGGAGKETRKRRTGLHWRRSERRLYTSEGLSQHFVLTPYKIRSLGRKPAPTSNY